MDELLWAALWLYKATDNEGYFHYVINNALSLGALLGLFPEFSWDVKYAGVQIIACKDILQKSNQKLSCPGGSVGHEELLSFAKTQVDYILGSNPMNMSYLVGYGPNFPTRVHHRAASIVSYRENKGFIGCTQGYDNWYSRVEPNPNVIFGALVGGPDCQDSFGDERGNYMQTEACTYNTAPLVGVFAKLNHLQDQKEVQLDQNLPLIASY
ncbi:hypothetical protein F0562_008255 [Nyssa sinensis]|uniref:Endoglucanase n=1 Tax=Nyssa sinensis TaxID=561372 RepID=A0A5J5A9H3_9ASTE|nr:hypothetical protein F0562_008255 [Nyssa sinensis]